MKRISQRTIEIVLSEVTIMDVVTVELKKIGAYYRGRCPFHQEKTPSFYVFPATNTFKCFGCGIQGHAVNYVMMYENCTFPEAIRKMAAIKHIEVIEETYDAETSEQKKEDAHRAELLDTYQRVQKFFVSNLSKNDEFAQRAREYATNRWGKELVDSCGIGFAFDDFNALRLYARQEHIREDLLLELGLLKKNDEKNSVYDFFRGRVMIPIRNASQMIIGYTARWTEEFSKTKYSEDFVPAKYLNTINNLLYSKDKSIFGIDRAIRAMSSADLCYMVEGGPDVLRLQSIGVVNSVASLGADWTKSQLETIMRYTRNVCLIPDIDVVKKGELFGTGIKKVMKTGEVCLEKGFDKVFVKEIIVSNKDGKKGLDPKTKHDADSYFKTHSLFEHVKETPFIVWYASKLAQSQHDRKDDNIGILARLLCYIKSDYQVSLLLTEIKPYINASLKVWNTAIDEARCEMAKQQASKETKNVIDTEILEKFGFQEANNYYFSIGDRGKRIPWSNFALHPLFHVKDVINSSRLFRIINEDGCEQIIELSQEDLVSRSKFMAKIESLGNYLWLAKDEQLIALKRYLYKMTDTAYLIRQMGWQKRDAVYAFGNGVLYGNVWYKADKFGIARVASLNKNFYLPSASCVYADDDTIYQFERSFELRNQDAFSLNEYVSAMIKCFGDNAKVSFAFLIAALFRDIVTRHTKSFPILDVFGVKGSGKSELGHTLMAFFIRNNTPANIQNSTIAALADTVAQCANALVHIDEYKSNIDINKLEFLKGLWDGAGRTRMNMDRDKKREITQVDSSVILTGQEMPNADVALFSRMIFLKTSMKGKERSPEERQNFEKLFHLRQIGCSHLTREILSHRPQFEANFAASMQKAYKDLMPMLTGYSVEERVINNWLVPLAALLSIGKSLDLPYSYDDLLSISYNLILDQNSMMQNGTEVADFWNTLGFLYQEGKLFESSDYRLKVINQLQIEPKKGQRITRNFPEAKHVLFLRTNHAVELYKLHTRNRDLRNIDEQSLMYYLCNDTSIFLGRSVSMRFRHMVNGMQQYEIKKDAQGNATGKQIPLDVFDHAYCFDYKAVQEQYGIQLTSASQSETNDCEARSVSSDT